jgi:ABC-2 type transport system ATP-binding protein
MERLIDDVLIMDYNRVLTQRPVAGFMKEFKQFYFEIENENMVIPSERFIVNIERVKNKVELYTYETEDFIINYLKNKEIVVKGFRKVEMSLEDAFIGLTGKY